MMSNQFYRDTWAEVNLDHVQENIKAIKGLLPEETSIMAVVKANAYGHGDIQVAKAALGAGATSLAVAFLDEGIRLRELGVEVPILVLGSTRPSDAPIAAKYGIRVNVHSKSYVEEALKVLDGSERPLYIHIKVDTGMSRLGIRTKEEMKDLEYILQNQNKIQVEGVFTHFAKADEIELDHSENQLTKFISILHSMDTLPPMIHTSNSAASMRMPEAYFNMVRVGIAMYGLSPSPEIKDELPVNLKPALSLYTKVKQVKQIHEGDTVSYGGTYEAKGEEWIATLPIGYADGWIRKLSGQNVLIKGKKAPIVGRICMDQCMVKLDEPVEEDAVVTLIGTDGNEAITADELAEKLETINYEITCQLSSRIPRVYKAGGKTVEIVNMLFRK
ncbi:alanine racemase [Pradoshia sp.]|uniref:alanine racemase n=1 Tax=Bacillaceae TaxID=186817 RepID=UPI000A512BA5